ncbi:MAG: site-specific DNA-methyltransferase [Gammaproteobacteria bacterium]|nr:site-specific DNA-methyltransferase [Gammaproteobacteria bacterium]
MARSRTKRRKSVEAFTHDGAKRRNIPTAECQPVMRSDDQNPIQVAYERRNPDLDPQLVWRGKDVADWSNLVVQAPPLFIQEKVHPKVLIDDLARMSRKARAEKDAAEPGFQTDIFGDFNGLPDDDAKTEFYQHDANWSNRMILGDALQVMASLAEREGLRGKVQCIYIDPPYGIKFNSNFQWSTTSRDVKDGKAEHITREPEQVKAFRDTWRDGIHSYLTYLRDRLTVARDLLTDSGSIFVQIGDENVHRVRAVMDEVFGNTNFVSQIVMKTTSGAGSPSGGTLTLASVHDLVLWYAKEKERVKYRQLYFDKAEMQSASLYRRILLEDGSDRIATKKELAEFGALPDGTSIFRPDNLTSQSSPESATFKVTHRGGNMGPGKGGWKTNPVGMRRLQTSNRLYLTRNGSLQYIRKLEDFNVAPINDVWTDVGTGSFTADKVYVVQTNTKVVHRCFLMASDPGDLVLDPTCGSGTSAYVAEQWGRRWITIDTSRVALALARSRVMGARYPYYLLADSAEGQRKEADLSRSAPSKSPTYGDIRQGFVCERVPHITLKSIANNTEVDVIYERMQPQVDAALTDLNHALRGHAWSFEVETGGRKGEIIDFTAAEGATVALPSGESAPANGFLEWEVPREPDEGWDDTAQDAHAHFWEARIARQHEIDACIAAHAEYETLYDKPYEDKAKTRVAGPFTVESVSPHRLAALDEDDKLMIAEPRATYDAGASTPVQDFAHMVLENLRTAGVQQADKRGHIKFTSLNPWPGSLVCAEGRYAEGGDAKTAKEQRAGIFIGPEFGTVSRADLVRAVREAADLGFDALIACAFNYEAHATEFNKLGRVPVLKARMNADLHMADDLKKTDKANLFVIFGEPDIDIEPATGPDGEPDWLQVKINGVDVFDPSTGEVRSDEADGIACWFVDTDYNEESFFVRQAYFLGAGDPYKSLKTTLKAEIDPDAWATLNSDTSRAFPKPSTGRIAVKVINHLGDEVMKVFGV